MNSKLFSGISIRAVLVLFVVITLAIPGAFAAPVGSGKKATSRPNVILLKVDDHDLRSFQQGIQNGLFPNIKSIMAKGTTFLNYWVESSRGCPDRGTTFLGLNLANFLPRNGKCGVSVIPDGSTIFTWAKAGGVDTALIGRVNDGNGYTVDRNGDGVINNEDAKYVPPGIDHYEGFVFRPSDGWHVDPGGVTTARENANMWNTAPMAGYTFWNKGTGQFERPSTYQVDEISARTAAYLQSRVGQTNPFFLYVAPTSPHIECFPNTPINTYSDATTWDITPPTRYAGTTTGFLLPYPNVSSFNVKDSGKPAWVQNVTPVTDPTSLGNLNHQNQDRIAAFRAADDLVGNILTTLSSTGLLANTVIMITSDNGWDMLEHGLLNKANPYDEASRVYLIVNRGGGVNSNALIMNKDVPATIVDLLGLAPTFGLDGTSFKPLLSNPNLAWRKYGLLNGLQVSSQSNPGPFAVPNYFAVVTSKDATSASNLKLILWQRGQPGITQEVYDRLADPYEMTNQYMNQAYGGRKQFLMQNIVPALQSCSATTTPCHNVEFQ